MKSAGSLKKYSIENRIDKDGDSDPRLVVTVEFKFSEQAVVSLAALTDGSQVYVTIEDLQPSLFSGKGSPLDDPQSGATGVTDAEVEPAPPADPDQRLLPWDGEIIPEAEAEESEAVDPDE